MRTAQARLATPDSQICQLQPTQETALEGPVQEEEELQSMLKVSLLISEVVASGSQTNTVHSSTTSLLSESC